MLSNRNTQLFLAKNVKICFACLFLVSFCFFFYHLFSFAGDVLAQTQNDIGNGNRQGDNNKSKADNEVDKSTITFNVSTSDYKNWYDDRCANGIDDDSDGKIDMADADCDGGDKVLRVNMICDKDANKSSGYMLPFPTDLKYIPCDKDGIHDDYYSTGTTNESNVWTSDKNFTVKITASDPSGIDSIRIEWISGASIKREAADYWDANNLEKYKKDDAALNPHKSSFTCSNSKSCEICVVGGSCAHPVIPTGDLGIAGLQQLILFRAVVTDGAMNSITTGFDDTGIGPKLDKFYRFVVCSNSCNTDLTKCKNSNPTVSLIGYEHSNFCSAPTYTLKWKFEDVNIGDKPSSYLIEVRNKKNPSVVYSAVRSSGDVTCRKGGSVVCEMSAILFNNFLSASDGTSMNIVLGNNTYDWRVKVYDNSKENHCLGISQWSSWSSDLKPSLSIVTPYSAPSVSFTMKNSEVAPKDCFSGECKFGEDIKFSSTGVADVNTGGIASYEWFIDGLRYGNKNSASFTNNFPVGQTKHTVALTITDKQGIHCTKKEELILDFPAAMVVPVKSGSY